MSCHYFKSPVSDLSDLERLTRKDCLFKARQNEALTNHNIHSISTVPDFIKIRILTETGEVAWE